MKLLANIFQLISVLIILSVLAIVAFYIFVQKEIISSYALYPFPFLEETLERLAKNPTLWTRFFLLSVVSIILWKAGGNIKKT